MAQGLLRRVRFDIQCLVFEDMGHATRVGANADLSVSLLELLARATAGDEDARNELATRLLQRLRMGLRRRMPLIDPSIIEDAMEDAVLALLERPSLYVAAKSDLESYIRLASMRNVLDSVRKATRRRAIESQAAAAMPLATSPATLDKEPDRVNLLLHLAVTPVEREFARALLIGSHPQDLARILGLGDVSQTVQRREVKRTTERLRIRWRRMFGLGTVGLRRARRCG